MSIASISSRRFWIASLVALVVADMTGRWLLDFDFLSVLRFESVLFTVGAAVLFLRMRREDSSTAWPRWVRAGIISSLLLAVVRSGSHSLGLELYLANLTTLAIAIIAAVAWRLRSRGRFEVERTNR